MMEMAGDREPKRTSGDPFIVSPILSDSMATAAPRRKKIAPST